MTSSRCSRVPPEYVEHDLFLVLPSWLLLLWQEVPFPGPLPGVLALLLALPGADIHLLFGADDGAPGDVVCFGRGLDVLREHSPVLEHFPEKVLRRLASVGGVLTLRRLMGDEIVRREITPP